MQTEDEIYIEIGKSLAPRHYAIKKLIDMGYSEPFLTEELDRIDKELKKKLEILKKAKRGTH